MTSDTFPSWDPHNHHTIIAWVRRFDQASRDHIDLREVCSMREVATAFRDMILPGTHWAEVSPTQWQHIGWRLRIFEALNGMIMPGDRSDWDSDMGLLPLL